jgi:hypothetical protein
MQLQPGDIAVEVIGGEAAQSPRATEPPDVQHAILYFDRPGRAEVSVEKGQLRIHVYEGVAVDLDQPARGGFGCNDGENQSWRWGRGEPSVTAVDDSPPNL